MFTLQTITSTNTVAKLKFGHRVQRDYKHGIELYAAAGNNKWTAAHQLKMEKILEAFLDGKLYHMSKIHSEFNEIQV